MRDRALLFTSIGVTVATLSLSTVLAVTSFRPVESDETRPPTLSQLTPPLESSSSPEDSPPVTPPSSAIFGLFGIPERGVPADIEPETLPVTALDLVLTGTFVHDNPPNSSALIQLPGDPSVRFYPGDQLPNGATVQAIQSEVVILNFDDTLQSLYFPNRQEQH